MFTQSGEHHPLLQKDTFIPQRGGPPFTEHSAVPAGWGRAHCPGKAGQPCSNSSSGRSSGGSLAGHSCRLQVVSLSLGYSLLLRLSPAHHSCDLREEINLKDLEQSVHPRQQGLPPSRPLTPPHTRVHTELRTARRPCSHPVSTPGPSTRQPTRPVPVPFPRRAPGHFGGASLAALALLLTCSSQSMRLTARGSAQSPLWSSRSGLERKISA